MSGANHDHIKNFVEDHFRNHSRVAAWLLADTKRREDLSKHIFSRCLSGYLTEES
jgi:GAF domain-containing protein